MWINVTYSISICIVNVVLKSKNKKKFYILFLSRTSISKTVDRVKFEPLPLYINPLLSLSILTQTLNFQTKLLHQFPIPASNAYFETIIRNRLTIFFTSSICLRSSTASLCWSLHQLEFIRFMFRMFPWFDWFLESLRISANGWFFVSSTRTVRYEITDFTSWNACST